MPHKRIDPVKPEGILETARKLIQANNILDSRILLYWRGTWDIDHPYEPGSVVTDGTSIWIALRKSIGVEPVEGDDWTMVSLVGASSRAFAMFIS